jgi:hypothetical protein
MTHIVDKRGAPVVASVFVPEHKRPQQQHFFFSFLPAGPYNKKDKEIVARLVQKREKRK